MSFETWRWPIWAGRQKRYTRGSEGWHCGHSRRKALEGSYIQHQLVRIYILVGEYDKALDELEPLLKVPYVFSPGWLRVDPNHDPLRGNQRFERLVAAH